MVEISEKPDLGGLGPAVTARGPGAVTDTPLGHLLRRRRDDADADDRHRSALPSPTTRSSSPTRPSAHDRLHAGGAGRHQLPLPARARDRPRDGGGGAPRHRRAQGARDRDPELPQGRLDFLERPVHLAGPTTRRASWSISSARQLDCSRRRDAELALHQAQKWRPWGNSPRHRPRLQQPAPGHQRLYRRGAGARRASADRRDPAARRRPAIRAATDRAARLTHQLLAFAASSASTDARSTSTPSCAA